MFRRESSRAEKRLARAASWRRGLLLLFATGVTPAMEAKMVGQGSQYPWTSLDADGKPFDGGKT
jgi:hypothetical protein